MNTVKRADRKPVAGTPQRGATWAPVHRQPGRPSGARLTGAGLAVARLAVARLAVADLTGAGLPGAVPAGVSR